MSPSLTTDLFGRPEDLQRVKAEIRIAKAVVEVVDCLEKGKSVLQKPNLRKKTYEGLPEFLAFVFGSKHARAGQLSEFGWVSLLFSAHSFTAKQIRDLPEEKFKVLLSGINTYVQTQGIEDLVRRQDVVNRAHAADRHDLNNPRLQNFFSALPPKLKARKRERGSSPMSQDIQATKRGCQDAVIPDQPSPLLSRGAADSPRASLSHCRTQSQLESGVVYYEQPGDIYYILGQFDNIAAFGEPLCSVLKPRAATSASMILSANPWRDGFICFKTMIRPVQPFTVGFTGAYL
ncbi:hypothetical protein TOPH_09236, partial [Tolypocladium ophioglossoides CBS 100239]